MMSPHFALAGQTSPRRTRALISNQSVSRPCQRSERRSGSFQPQRPHTHAHTHRVTQGSKVTRQQAMRWAAEHAGLCAVPPLVSWKEKKNIKYTHTHIHIGIYRCVHINVLSASISILKIGGFSNTSFHFLFPLFVCEALDPASRNACTPG